MSLDNLRHKAERCTTHHYCDCAWYKINKLGIELANAEAQLKAAEAVVEAARTLRRDCVIIPPKFPCGKCDACRLDAVLKAYDSAKVKGEETK